MGDLQCPARLWLSLAGDRLGVSELALLVRGERIAAVYTGPAAVAGPGLATTLHAAWSPEPRLAAGSPGSAGTGRGADQVREVLAEIADRHRGEAVLIVGDPDVVGPAMTGLGPGIRAAADEGGLVALEADSAGWRLVGPVPTSPHRQTLR